ncbi:MAG: MFS transporter, partial [Gammaproteobacteria bacterium]
IRWVPDRRGMATGLAIMGFGGGAMLGKPMIDGFLRLNYRAPEYLGVSDAVELVTEAGRRMAMVGGELREVVVVGANDVAAMIVPGPEGVYLAGTGTVGVAQTFFTLGAIYFVVMMVAAFAYRVPPPGWQPAGWQPPAADGATRAMITRHDVDIDQALRTPQFYQLWIVLCFNVTAGIGVLAVAKTMMTEIFGTTLPNIVDLEFAATYVLMISVFNMLGRFFWASASDYLGRRNTYHLFFGLGILLYCSIPFFASQVSAHPAVTWLVGFYAATMLIFTMYGGGFATIPAYLADVFGTRYVGGIHGRLLTAWSTAGVLGPLAITTLRENAVARAIDDLVSHVEPARFEAAFGAGLAQLDQLVAANTVTIAKLMELVPPGTPNPTPGLYNETMYLMAGLLALALVANALMRPVHPRHHMATDAEANAALAAAVPAADTATGHDATARNAGPAGGTPAG